MEILFRIWDEISKTMTYPLTGKGDDIYLSLEGQPCTFDEGDIDLQYRGYRFTPLIYTGKEDANGKHIFDGDILASVKYGTNELSSSKLRWEIYYNDERLTFYRRDKKEGLNEPFWEFELGSIQHIVIGNIYENPELVNV